MISYVLYKDKCLMVIICYNFTKKNIIIWRRNCKRENVSKLYFHFFKKKCSKSLFKEIMHLLLLYGKERQHLRSLKLRKCNQKRKWRFFKKKILFCFCLWYSSLLPPPLAWGYNRSWWHSCKFFSLFSFAHSRTLHMITFNVIGVFRMNRLFPLYR